MWRTGWAIAWALWWAMGLRILCLQLKRRREEMERDEEDDRW